MPRSFKLFKLLIFILYAPFSFSQVKGRVVDSVAILPIKGASITLVLADDSSHLVTGSADSLGYFELAVIRPARYILRVSSVGYNAKQFSVALADKHDLGAIRLSPRPQVLENITVTAGQRPVSLSQGNTIIQVAGNTQLKTALNLLDVLKNTPGIQVAADGSLQMGNRVRPVFFLNGKPLLLDGEALNNYLKTLTPDKVASMEVITNPGAQYDAEYKGVIDIRLKKNHTEGWSGNYSSLLQQNRYTNSNHTLNLFYTRDKFSATAVASYMAGSDIYRYRTYQHLASTDILQTKLDQKNLQRNPGIQLGISYQPNTMHQMGLQLRDYIINSQRERSGSLYAVKKAGDEIAFFTKSNNPTHYVQKNRSARLDYTFQKEKTRISFLGSVLEVTNTQQDAFINTDQLTQKESEHWNTDLLNKIRVYTAQADLSRKLKNWYLDAGVKFSRSVTNNDIRYDTLQIDPPVFVPDASRSNLFIYNEDINAAYISANGKIGSIQVTAGLRGEQTLSRAHSVTTASSIHKSYIQWLPSATVHYQIDQRQELSFSYARRITRPPFSQLNPFRFYLSALNYWIGNPYLDPSTTSQFKINYRFRSYLLELNAGKESDVISRYPMYDTVTNEMAFLGTNLPYRKFANISVVLPFTVNKLWQINLQLMGYYNKEQQPYLDKIYNPVVYNYVLKLNQVFTFNNHFSATVFTNYESRSGNSLYIFKPMYHIDIALQKGWFSNKLHTRVAFSDILNTYYQQLQFRYKEIINNQFSHWWGMQKLQATISYSFGKASQHKKTAVSEEENRATR
ncbi:TonB-dependent receptor [Niabella sp. CC-SYL272]|uniref:outer membrane beta-barrel protein n=1 Tax=Niabella agricola TaxID=2891571 RepID=UPI001F215037|nr:outer membrane beta-barrel protein [Niabella agricola]MCF3108014.1 TonB-dependent receptor [Niabella agricola]